MASANARVTVNFYATLREVVGRKQVDFEAGTVAELIETVVTRYPPLRTELLNGRGELWPHVHVFVNGRDAPYLEEGLATKLKDGDVVDVFPAVAGG